MTIDRRVFQHKGNEGFRVEERLLLREQKRFLCSRQEDDFTDCVGQDPTLYLPRPDYRPHRFQPSIDRHYLVALPVEKWGNTAKSRLAVTSLKWQLLNFGGGEQQVVGCDAHGIDSHDQIGGGLINGASNGAVGKSRNCGWLYYRRAVHRRRLQGQRPGFSSLFCVAASRA